MEVPTRHQSGVHLLRSVGRGSTVIPEPYEGADPIVKQTTASTMLDMQVFSPRSVTCKPKLALDLHNGNERDISSTHWGNRVRQLKRWNASYPGNVFVSTPKSNPASCKTNYHPRRRCLKRYENGSRDTRIISNWPRSMPNLRALRAPSSLVALYVQDPNRIVAFRTIGQDEASDEKLVILGEYLQTSKETKPPRHLQRYAITDGTTASRDGDPSEQQGAEGTKECLLFFGSSHALRSILREKENRRLAEEARDQLVERRTRRLKRVQASYNAKSGDSHDAYHSHRCGKSARVKQLLVDGTRKVIFSSISTLLHRLPREEH